MCLREIEGEKVEEDKKKEKIREEALYTIEHKNSLEKEQKHLPLWEYDHTIEFNQEKQAFNNIN